MADELRRIFERALVSVIESPEDNGRAERAVAFYCRERHREGAGAEAVLGEIKRIALPILRQNYGHLEKTIATCIQRLYRGGDN